MEGPPETRAKIPSLRSIEGILAENRKQEDEEGAPADLLRPDAMGLPLDSLRFLLSMAHFVSLRTGQRWQDVLTERHCRWMWWVRKGAPDLPIEYLLILAGYLSMAEQVEKALGESLPCDWVVDFVVYRPWSSKDALDEYHEAIQWRKARSAPEPALVRASAIGLVKKDVMSEFLNLSFPTASAITRALKEIEADLKDGEAARGPGSP